MQIETILNRVQKRKSFVCCSISAKDSSGTYKVWPGPLSVNPFAWIGAENILYFLVVAGRVGGGRGQAPQHLHDPRHRRVGRPLIHRHGVEPGWPADAHRERISTHSLNFLAPTPIFFGVPIRKQRRNLGKVSGRRADVLSRLTKNNFQSNREPNMINKPLSIFIILLTTISINFPASASDCKYCCERRAILNDFRNNKNPDFEEQQKKWMDCVNEGLGGGNAYDPDGSIYEEVIEACKHLEPEYGLYMYPRSVLLNLAVNLTTQYFHMLWIFSGFSNPLAQKTEYKFKGSYEGDIDDGSAINGKPLVSRFILELYYSGDTEELIKSWSSEKSINSIPAHYDAMMRDADAKISADKPIHEKLLWDFEKTPVECDIKPQKDEVFPGQMIDITISNCKGRKGAPSREFQRLVATAEHGYIVNGAPVPDPDYEAFSYGNGDVKIKYQAPGNCNNPEDVISVYNSCDIYNSTIHPLELTEKNREIGKARIKINCENGFISITRKFTKRVERQEYSKDKDGAVSWTSLKKTIETHTVGVRGRLVHYTGLLMPDLSPYSGQYWDSFRIENIEIVSNHAELSEVTNGSGGISTLYEATIGTPGVSKLLWGDTGMLRLIYEKEKTILLDAKIPANIVDTDWTIQYDLVDTRGGTIVQERHTSSNIRKGFTIMRIEEGDVPLEINGGDKNYYGSENERTEIYETLPDGGYVKGYIEHIFDWNISLE